MSKRVNRRRGEMRNWYERATAMIPGGILAEPNAETNAFMDKRHKTEEQETTSAKSLAEADVLAWADKLAEIEAAADLGMRNRDDINKVRHQLWLNVARLGVNEQEVKDDLKTQYNFHLQQMRMARNQAVANGEEFVAYDFTDNSMDRYPTTQDEHRDTLQAKLEELYEDDYALFEKIALLQLKHEDRGTFPPDYPDSDE